MIFKVKYILLVVFSMVSLFGFSQQSAEDVLDGKPDTTFVVPNEFNNTLDFLLHSWLIQRSKPSNCSSSVVPLSPTDSIYRLRLSKMPCLMEMPFNNTVRAFIELYTVKKRRQVEYMMGMSDYYFPIFEQVLSANNLPVS